ncbi:MAG: AAA family ATPase [Bdellovibrionota bacterium]
MSLPESAVPATPETNPKPTFAEEIRKHIISKYSLINVVTFEDFRCGKTLAELCKVGFKTPLEFFSWSSTDGLVHNDKKIDNTHEAIKALDYVMTFEGSAIFLFKDLYSELKENPKLVRKLRDVYQALKNNFKTLIMTSPTAYVPNEMSKEVAILDFPLPTLTELEKLLNLTLESIKGVPIELSDQDKDDFVKSATGLTWDEARLAFLHAFSGRKSITREAVKVVIEEKSRIVRKDGILEYIDVDFSMSEIGGLENLKDWLLARARFFSKEAQKFGLSAPKGILLTGIAGCGKSSCVKAISQYWRLPLMRLDMTKIYGGVVGNPEESMRRALMTIEAVAPVILWIEEIEKGVAGFNQGDGGVTARIFSSFLTWMQEKKSLVFVAATANQIDQLPPELLRKGRFDEIFFTDLPDEKERAEIFKVHISKRNHDPVKFKLVELAKATNGFSGAEIEQVVASGMFTAFSQKRKFNDLDLYKEISKTVPLSTTMAEQIKEIKRGPTNAPSAQVNNPSLST